MNETNGQVTYQPCIIEGGRLFVPVGTRDELAHADARRRSLARIARRRGRREAHLLAALVAVRQKLKRRDVAGALAEVEVTLAERAAGLDT